MLLLRRFQPSLYAYARSATTHSGLKECLAQKIEEERARVIAFRKSHGKKVIDKLTVNQIIGGMRNLRALYTVTSIVHPTRGVIWREREFSEVMEQLPKLEGSEETMPEGLIWFLLTGDMPTYEQSMALSKELEERRGLPTHIKKMISGIDCYAAPMVQLSAAIVLLSPLSKFKTAVEKGMKKPQLWESALEDMLYLLANLPEMAARIYAHTYRGGELGNPNLTSDWAGNFADMLGFENELARDLMRLHLTVHCDHDLGNVSSHAVHLVGSALSDPFISYSAGVNGLAGPLHGGAAQESVVFITGLVKKYGVTPSDDEITSHIQGMLERRQVIPGFGHGVLRVTDPRYLHIRQFALRHFPDDPYVRVVEQLFKLVPPLIEHKAANPYPNIDGYSGVTWRYVGLTGLDFNTVLFAVSRCLGALTQYVWSRALLLPIERPHCVTLQQMEEI